MLHCNVFRSFSRPDRASTDWHLCQSLSIPYKWDNGIDKPKMQRKNISACIQSAIPEEIVETRMMLRGSALTRRTE